MPFSSLPVYFENAAGQVLEHPSYAILRYRPGKRLPDDLPTLLTRLGQLLVKRGWDKFLVDARQTTPLNETEKAWFLAHWLGHRVERPAPLLGVIILPTEVVARLSIQQMVSSASGTTLYYITFTDPAEAEAYLTEK